ncbi:PAS domain S-box protein [Bacillus sp. ISL-35]|uniref:ATP-binding protein n=1 Tax=Bacillus sp. ISL-35 TaxID=2819122 RepID=UPI001BE78E60|nr:ATP-binding protein [Bacillus sp. ISL-35]MBT2680289.1 PAS domain S-box protein [Bacillus sp. ISL-35]MBT2702880.1 PAS domain S-box protein [Chryseobacterium sp. ISL-80]
MILIDYIINLSMLSLMVSTPLVIRSYLNHKPLKQLWLWVGLYGGVVSSVLVMFSFQDQGYSYDIRYSIIILVFAYLGPGAGMITGSIALASRLMESENWFPAIIGWFLVMTILVIAHRFTMHLKPAKRVMILLCSYIVTYIITVPIILNVIRDNPVFHLQYLLFVSIGVLIGGILIESYEKLYRIIKERKRMEQTLEESESKYRLIAENTSDLIMVMDKEHAITYFSPSHEMVLGFKVEELEKTEICKLIHPDDVVKFRGTITQLMKNKESMPLEFRFQDKSGKWIDFESRWMPVMSDEQVIEHIVIISRDISERKKAEEILLQSEKLSIVGELAAGVAHEIRNPLTTIKGFVQLYGKEGKSNEINNLLLSELERIETITSEMLSLGKPQAIQLNRANLCDLIDHTVEFLSPQANMKNIQFSRSYLGTDFFITCEKNQIKQVFLNIFKNAMEAMPKGGNIDIKLQRGINDDCIISVQDEGSGIPEELLPRLGEPFYTLKEKGTGLGLMICHKIIKQHNGAIFYHSKLDHGTLVEIRLPLIS